MSYSLDIIVIILGCSVLCIGIGSTATSCDVIDLKSRIEVLEKEKSMSMDLTEWTSVDERRALVDRIRRAWDLADKRDEKHLLRKEWIDEYFLTALEEFGVEVKIKDLDEVE